MLCGTKSTYNSIHIFLCDKAVIAQGLDLVAYLKGTNMVNIKTEESLHLVFLFVNAK